MKIKQIYLHNIASIEEAEIDFERTPLADSEVFLITGNTGSGKSTILDAICLALFNETPRMHQTEMEGGTMDGGNKLSINDPRQILRKNTVEGLITLTFEGNNGCPYTARWSVYRAHKKSTGKLQQVGWELSFTKGGKEQTLTKQAEIRSEMEEALGLTFNQFCRTTMLAQGEFTRFLNSKDEEKAAILEKITGVDIYSKIGAKIYAETQRREKLWTTAKSQADAIAILTDEETETLHNEVKELEKGYAEKKALRERQQAKRQWLEAETEKEKKVEEAGMGLAKAQDTVNSEEFRRWDTIVNQWRETIQARGWYASQKETIGRLEELKSEYDRLANRFINLQSGADGAEEQSVRKAKETERLDAYFEKEKGRKEVYEQSEAIAIHLLAFIDNAKRVAEKRNASARLAARLQVLQKEMCEAQSAEEERNKAYESQKLLLEKSEATLASVNLPQLHRESDELKETRRRVQLTREHHGRLEEIRQARRAKEATLQQLSSGIANAQMEIKEIIEQAKAAKREMEESNVRLDRQKDTVDKFAKAMRSRLRIGDHCPVCNAEIKGLIHEEEFTLLYAEAEKEANANKQRYENLVNNYRSMDARIKTDTATYNREKQLFDNDTSVKTAEETFLADCQRVGLSPEEGMQRLDELDQACQTGIRSLEKRIADGEVLDKEVRGQRNLVEQLRKQVQQLTEVSLRKKEEKDQCDKEIELAKKEIDLKEEAIKQAKESIGKMVDASLWETDWQENPYAFKQELTDKTQTYRQRVTLRQALGTELEQLRQTNDRVRQTLNEIAQTVPEWQSTGTVEPHEVADLTEETNRLKTRVTELCAQKRDADDKYQRVSERLNAYYAENPTYDGNLFDRLNGVSQNDIAKTNTYLESCRSDVKTRTEMLTAAKQELEAHLTTKPLMEEDETIAVLTVQTGQLDNDLRLLDEERGKVMQRLQTNETNKKRRESLDRTANELHRDYDRWRCVSIKIGDSTGKTFQKIAQSYVLESLIHAANAYMNTLSNRYTLKFTPGTFVILIEDAYQGYASRAASTLSGGESFLVSLSLALALSDIGHQFAVDTLFIDEGFGTLSGEPLQNAIATLRTLHKKNGRHVGIISHVEELKERIPVQIQVQQSGNTSSSKVTTVSV